MEFNEDTVNLFVYSCVYKLKDDLIGKSVTTILRSIADYLDYNTEDKDISYDSREKYQELRNKLYQLETSELLKSECNIVGGHGIVKFKPNDYL